MEKDNTYDQDLSELYEGCDCLDKPNEPKSGSFLTIPVLLVLVCVVSNILGIDVSLGDVLNIHSKEEESASIEKAYHMENDLEGSNTDIDYRLQNGELLSDVVKDYFKSEYGLDIAIVDTVDATEGAVGDDILKLITVKDIDSGSAYEFRYNRKNGVTTITDTYGSTLTSKLLGVKLTEYYKKALPEGSTVWVDSESLGLHSKVENSDIANIIMNSSIEDLKVYTDEVNLFRGIGLNIVEEQDILSDNQEDYVMKYRGILLDIDTMFKKDDVSPRLEVVFLNGEEGKLNVLTYLEQKIGLTTVGGSFFIKWYDEIPMMGEEANGNIIGAMSIKTNITDVLMDYYNNDIGTYFDKSTEKYVPVYSSVSEIMESSIVNERRSLAGVLN